MKQLKELRELRGWTQSDMSEKFEVSINTVKSWETGRRNPNRWIRQEINKLLISAGIEKILPTAKEVDDLLSDHVFEETAKNIIDSGDIL